MKKRFKFLINRSPAKARPVIRFLGNLQKLKLRDGEIFVLSTEKFMTGDQVDKLWSDFNLAFSTNKVIILQGGMKIGIVSPEVAA